MSPGTGRGGRKRGRPVRTSLPDTDYSEQDDTSPSSPKALKSRRTNKGQSKNKASAKKGANTTKLADSTLQCRRSKRISAKYGRPSYSELPYNGSVDLNISTSTESGNKQLVLVENVNSPKPAVTVASEKYLWDCPTWIQTKIKAEIRTSAGRENAFMNTENECVDNVTQGDGRTASEFEQHPNSENVPHSVITHPPISEFVLITAEAERFSQTHDDSFCENRTSSPPLKNPSISHENLTLPTEPSISTRRNILSALDTSPNVEELVTSCLRLSASWKLHLGPYLQETNAPETDSIGLVTTPNNGGNALTPIDTSGQGVNGTKSQLTYKNTDQFFQDINISTVPTRFFECPNCYQVFLEKIDVTVHVDQLCPKLFASTGKNE